MKKQMISGLTEYEIYLRGRELSESTRCVYLYATKKFLVFQEERVITKQSVQIYAQTVRVSYRATTSNLYLIALNQFLVWKGCGEYCVKVKKIRRKKRMENVLDKGEYQQILNYLAARKDRKYYALLRTLAGTGIRISELKYITTDAVASGMAEVLNKGKTREIYIGNSLKEELLSYCKSCRIREGVIFRGNKDRPITRGAVNQKLIKIAERAGVDPQKVHPHAFRHLFAKEYMKRYQNIAELSCILGHERVETTMIYLANSSQEYIERVSGLDL